MPREFTITVKLRENHACEPIHSHVNIGVQWHERFEQWVMSRELVWSDGYVDRPRLTPFLDYHLAKRAAILRAIDELDLEWPLGEAVPEPDDLQLLASVTWGASHE